MDEKILIPDTAVSIHPKKSPISYCSVLKRTKNSNNGTLFLIPVALILIATFGIVSILQFQCLSRGLEEMRRHILEQDAVILALQSRMEGLMVVPKEPVEGVSFVVETQRRKKRSPAFRGGQKPYTSDEYDEDESEDELDNPILPSSPCALGTCRTPIATSGGTTGGGQVSSTWSIKKVETSQSGGGAIPFRSQWRANSEGSQAQTRSQSSSSRTTVSSDEDGRSLNLGGSNGNRDPDIARMLQLPHGVLRTGHFAVAGSDPCQIASVGSSGGRSSHQSSQQQQQSVVRGQNGAPCALAGSGGGSSNAQVSGYNYTYVREYSEGIPGGRNFSHESYVPYGSPGHTSTGSNSYSSSQDTRTAVVDTRSRARTFEEELEERSRVEATRRRQEEEEELVIRRRQQQEEEELRVRQTHRRQQEEEEEARRQEEEIRRLEEEVRRREQEEIWRKHEEIRRRQYAMPTTRLTTPYPTPVNNNVHYNRQYEHHSQYSSSSSGGETCRGPSPIAIHLEASQAWVSGTFSSWRQAEWTTTFTSVDVRRNFLLSTTSGVVAVLKSGLYYVYAQVTFTSETASGFNVEVNSLPFLKCSSGTSCHTSGLRYFRANDQVSLVDLSGAQRNGVEVEGTYFGIMNVGGTCE